MTSDNRRRGANRRQRPPLESTNTQPLVPRQPITPGPLGPPSASVPPLAPHVRKNSSMAAAAATRNTTLRISLRLVTVLAAAVTFSLLSALPASLACPLLLRGWSKNQTSHLSEKAERADIVALVRVVSSDRLLATKQTRRTYAADCLFLEVSKGLPSLTSSSAFDAEHRVQVVFGFGPVKQCLSEVSVGGIYLMMLTVRNGHIAIDYRAGIPAVNEFTPTVYGIVQNALGWDPWSVWSRCSASCGEAGEKVRNRTCSWPPCTYGVSQQTVPCNRWPCPETVNISKRVSAEPPAQQLSFSGPDILPRRIAAGFSLSYAQRLRQRVVRAAAGAGAGAGAAAETSGEFRLIEINSRAGQRAILNVQHFQNFIEIGLGRLQKLRFNLPDVPTGSQNSILIDFNSTQVNVYINCRRHSRPLQTEQHWSQLTTENVTVKFDGKMKKLVEDFLITAQHNKAPAECDEEVGSPPQPQPQPPPAPPAAVLVRPVPSSWSAWSRCSVSCGPGVQQRARTCEGGPESCGGAGRPTEERPCLRAPCSGAATFARPRTAAALPCIPACQNGGSCQNGACECPLGYHGARCQFAVCLRPCQNGGVCVGPNLCACPEGFGGNDCSRPICPRGCRNNGQCVAPRKCLCQVGFRGRRCQHVLCIPRCENGGKCIYPNVCSCKPGTYGQYCDKFECFPNCMNGGKCVGRNKCKCPKGFYGKYCHRVRCRHLCRNGGRCTRHGICRCPRGFFGPRCESKTCSPELKYRQINRPTIKSFYETSVRVCGKRRKKYCSERRLRSVVVYKIVMKPYFTCMVT